MTRYFRFAFFSHISVACAIGAGLARMADNFLAMIEPSADMPRLAGHDLASATYGDRGISNGLYQSTRHEASVSRRAAPRNV